MVERRSNVLKVLVSGWCTVTGKAEAIVQFSKAPLKHPMSKYLLQYLSETDELLKRVSFVQSRDFLPNTMLISELGSPRVGFELELGAHHKEEVSIVNGRLVRHTRRDRNVCITDPMEAIKRLHGFKSRLYVVFSFAGPAPSWYQTIVEPNPALPLKPDAKESIEEMIGEIVKEQVDLVLLAITLKEQVDKALRNHDRKSFKRTAPLYREVIKRCLWDL